MFGSIGMPEMIIILVIALIVFGPRKLPELGKSLGRSLAEFKRASNELRYTLEEEVRVEEQRDHAAKKAASDGAALAAGQPAAPGAPAGTPVNPDSTDGSSDDSRETAAAGTTQPLR
jgi:sec-independent protein translocase protein TatA